MPRDQGESICPLLVENSEDLLYLSPKLSEERIFDAIAAEVQIEIVRLLKARTAQALTYPPLIVVDHRKQAVCRHVIHEQFQDFTAPLDAAVKLGIRLRERVCL